MVKEFVALDKRKALRKALDYWYRNYVGQHSLAAFLACCAWKRDGVEYIVTFYGFPIVSEDVVKWR